MTVGEKEEKRISSNTKPAEIKIQNVEKQEQESINLHQIVASYFQIQIEKQQSMKQQLRIITESAAAAEEEEEDDDDDDDELKDPLLTTEEILLKYFDFIDFVYKTLKELDEQKEEDLRFRWKKWSEILERGETMVKSMNRSLRRIGLDMECIEAIEEPDRHYRLRKTFVPKALSMLRHINSLIESSNNFRLVSDVKNGRKVLPICLKELEKSRQQLSRMIRGMKALKEMELKLEYEEQNKVSN